MSHRSWRALGFVPDSDDDDDDVSLQDSQISISSYSATKEQPVTPLPTSVEVVVPCNPIEATHLLQHDSSSDLPGLPASESSRVPPAKLAQSCAIDDADALSNAFALEPVTEVERPLSVHFSERSLRERRPVQIRPYFTEAERYKQNLRARGIQPVNFREASATIVRSGEESEDEYSSEEGPYTWEHSALQSSSPRRTTSRATETVFHHKKVDGDSSQTALSEDDELPDLEAILKEGRAIAKHGAHRSLQSARCLSNGRSYIQSSNEQLASEANIFDIPDSPEEPPRAKRRKTFQVPASNQSTIRIPMTMPETDPLTVAISSDAMSDLSVSETGSQELIQKAARQVRGVLPRSFIALEYRKQQEQQTQITQFNKRSHPRVEDTSPARGVARPASRIHTKALLDSTMPDFVEAESEEIMESLRVEFRPLSTQHDRYSGPRALFLDPGSTMEDDAIDFLAPAISRKRKNSTARTRSRTTRQSRIDGSIPASESTSRISCYNRQYKSGIIRKHDTMLQSPRRSHHVHLGVLDVENTSSRYLPDFLMVARRQARKDKNFARHSPSAKYFRLQTGQDTEDVNLFLDDWKKGSISQRPLRRAMKATRRPLRSGFGHANAAYCTNSLPNGDSESAPFSTANSHPKRLTELVQKRNVVSRAPNRFSHFQRKLQSYVTTSKHPMLRTAQLESLEENVNIRNHRASLHIHVVKSNQEIWGRLLTDLPAADNVSVLQLPQAFQRRQNNLPTSTAAQGELTQRRQPSSRRRHVAQRKAVNSVQFRQTNVFENDTPLCSTRESTITKRESNVSLCGFKPSYPTDFDINPIPPGTSFHSSTLVGSGDFHRIITSNERSMTVDWGDHAVSYGGIEFTWGPWNAGFEGQLRQLMQKFYNKLKLVLDDSVEARHSFVASLSAITNDVGSYALANAKWLSFLDKSHFDQFSLVFAETLGPLVGLANEHLQLLLQRRQCDGQVLALIRLMSMHLSLCGQLILKGGRVHTSPRGLIRSTAQTLLDAYFLFGAVSVREYLNDNIDPSIREKGIRDHVWIETILVIHHILAKADISIWTIITESQRSFLSKAHHVSQLEKTWCGIMTINPLLEFDELGILIPRHRLRLANHDWTLIKVMCDKVFEFYSANAAAADLQVSSNGYIRTMLHRIHHLVETWSWKRPGIVVAPIYDFFANHKFLPLHDQESLKSPHFLLDPKVLANLSVTASDRCFHIFLKLLAVSLQSLAKISPPKHSKSLAWRCLPNHNRIHRKEDDLRQADLDALRNQHDLLCTLCMFGPAEYRARFVEKVRDLVDHNLSHQELCRLNIRSFKALALSELETDSNLEIFAVWVERMVEETLHQFRAARAQIELQYNSYQPVDRERMSSHCVQSTITSNQEQVLQTLEEIVAAMKAIIGRASCQAKSARFLEMSRFERIFCLLDEHTDRASRLMIDVLSLYDLFIRLPSSIAFESQSSLADESQDYGDWPEEDAKLEFIKKLLFRQLSNIFGSDKKHSKHMIVAMVEAWAQLAFVQVKRSQATWSSFLDAYGENSWRRLPDTNLQRQYSAVFYSSILDLDKGFFLTERQHVLSAWFVALVEPESLLVHQDKFTSAILNAAEGEDLLANLPFFRNSSGRYEIQLKVLKARRLALLSSVLANMSASSHISVTRRPEYVSFLVTVMAAMKKNFINIQQNDTERNQYVDFVHGVVEHLQQYTASVCPIDSFFLDSDTFPLPAEDPSYVVSKLKGYGENINDNMTKRLVSFMKSISEQQISENNSDRFTSQLIEAMAVGIEGPSCTLRSVLLEGVFPTYLQGLFQSPCGWILARPMLQATADVFRTIHFKFDMTDVNASVSVVSMISIALTELCRSVEFIIATPEQLRESSVLASLSLVAHVMSAAIAPLASVRRTRGLGGCAARALIFFKSFTIFCIETMHGKEHPYDMSLKVGIPSFQSTRYIEVQRFCSNDFSTSMRTMWIKEDDRYFFQSRGGQRKELYPAIRAVVEEKEAFLNAIIDFHNTLAGASMF